MKDQGIQVTAIDHVVLRVRDLERSMRFYCDVLGCAVERHQEAIGLMQLRAGAALIDLVPVDGQLGRKGGAAPLDEGRNMDHLCLQVRELEAKALHKYLQEIGENPEPPSKRYGAAGYGLSIYLQDPDGNTIELRAAD